jgi:hypothetical protein
MLGPPTVDLASICHTTLKVLDHFVFNVWCCISREAHASYAKLKLDKLSLVTSKERCRTEGLLTVCPMSQIWGM